MYHSTYYLLVASCTFALQSLLVTQKHVKKFELSKNNKIGVSAFNILKKRFKDSKSIVSVDREIQYTYKIFNTFLLNDIVTERVSGTCHH